MFQKQHIKGLYFNQSPNKDIALAMIDAAIKSSVQPEIHHTDQTDHLGDVNFTDNEGWTPLHFAVQSRNRDITKILLTNGADKTRRTKDGKVALDMALCFGRDFKSYDLVKLLKIIPTDDI